MGYSRSAWSASNFKVVIVSTRGLHNSEVEKGEFFPILIRFEEPLPTWGRFREAGQR